ncbi:alkaline-phosphatase-like protein [Auriculariales sp. MPI-PUGE-AT-0066]|nr:alkaline-phosphatase-like protein [Auriculariales sp. MPI-PUGE-AT-0066]
MHFLHLVALLSIVHSVVIAHDHSTGHHSRHQTRSNKKPNFVFILSDDQDYEMGSLDYMPLLKKHITQHGTSFERHFVTTAQCCPSRSSLWTSKATHNTNVTDVHAPNGGWQKFVKMGWNERYLPIWLSQEYNTYYTGKFQNGMAVNTYGKDKEHAYMKGWTSFSWTLTYIRQYSTDVIRDKGLKYINDAHKAGKPFFVGIAPVGPHVRTQAGKGEEHTPQPAKRHEHMFPNATVPRTPNFNPAKASGGGWVQKLERQSAENVASNDLFYRRRLQALQAVDELVEAVVQRLEKLKLLDNTYIFFSSDNGFHIGQHRLQPGKGCAYETDVHVPMMIRGPGVKAGERVMVPTTHIDVVPTIFSLAGITLRNDFDGTPMPLGQIGSDGDPRARHEHVGIEFWGDVASEGKFSHRDGKPVNTYKSLRIISDGDYSLSYTVWCTGDHELYDMSSDHTQMHNLVSSNGPAADAIIQVGGQRYPVKKVRDRLDAVVQAVKRCEGAACIKPWATLHPQGDVKTLRDAMAAKYDLFYDNQVKMKFDKCMAAYHPSNEGALPAAFHSSNNDEGDGNGKQKDTRQEASLSLDTQAGEDA